MKQIILINKPRLLYGKLLVRLYEMRKEIKGVGNEGFLPYSYIREKIGRNFSIKKSEIQELLFFLADIGFIELSQKGIKLNFKLKNE